MKRFNLNLFICCVLAITSYGQSENTLDSLSLEVTRLSNGLQNIQTAFDQMANDLSEGDARLSQSIASQSADLQSLGSQLQQVEQALSAQISSLDSTQQASDTRITNEVFAITNQLAKHETFEGLIRDVEVQLRNEVDIITDSLIENKSLLLTQVSIIYDSLQSNTAKLESNELRILEEEMNSEQGKMYTILSGAGVLIALLFVFVIYLLTQRKTKAIEETLDESKEDLKNQLASLRIETGEGLAKAIEKFAEVSQASGKEQNSEPDHSMVIQFAKQIITMENNLSRMDPETKGFKQLNRAIEKMHNTLNSMDYEITPLLGTSVIDGQIIDIRELLPDESITDSTKVVFNVVKAEILFKGELLQRGKVDVKHNPDN